MEIIVVALAVSDLVLLPVLTPTRRRKDLCNTSIYIPFSPFPALVYLSLVECYIILLGFPDTAMIVKKKRIPCIRQTSKSPQSTTLNQIDLNLKTRENVMKEKTWAR